MQKAEEVISWIHSLLPFGVKPGLKRMEWMLERLDHPENKLTAIHIGGTNGKGSTLSFVRHILQEEGLKIGTFTSPYLERFEERISFNGEPISEEDLVSIATEVRPLVEELAQTALGSPTEFEVITTMMFVYFGTRVKPDICLIEVGLGGRLDSTNVLSPILSIITMIGHDHMHILGSTLKEIAYEKAGIIKEQVPVIIGAIEPEAKKVINDVAVSKQAPLYSLGETFSYSNSTLNSFVYHDHDSVTYQMKMLGEHQHHNASLALKAVDLLGILLGKNISAQKRSGIHKALWPGRLEAMQENVLIDGAHNQEGYSALAAALKDLAGDKTIHLLIASTVEKDMTLLVKAMENLDVHYYFTTFLFHRAASAEQLYNQADVNEKSIVLNWQKFLSDKIETEQDLLVITGSLYFISDVRHYLQKMF
ncbi:LOW QUALITY PROTEIN: dihydrofolate synthase [Bacillus sp. JCM 19045]|nr:LOW QUALITY PROTEIN: dihydrofolate synthase [Bacillus sp. JCM 19045]